jgi:hypothetical protein
MAMTVPSPAAVTDLITLKQASEQFADCGKDNQVDPRTLKRWAAKHRVPMRRVGRDVVASWTDLLEVHAAEVDRVAGQA